MSVLREYSATRISDGVCIHQLTKTNTWGGAKIELQRHQVHNGIVAPAPRCFMSYTWRKHMCRSVDPRISEDSWASTSRFGSIRVSLDFSVLPLVWTPLVRVMLSNASKTEAPSIRNLKKNPVVEGVVFLFNANSGCNGACAHYVMVSKIQWQPFWLATQLIHEMTGLGGQKVWIMTYSHRPHCQWEKNVGF